MKNLLAAATIVASLALPSAALATPNGPQGYQSIIDTLGANARTAQVDTSATAPNRYQNTGSALAALQGYTTSGPAVTEAKPPNPYQNTGSASAALQGYTTSGPGVTEGTLLGYRSITDTPVGNGGNPVAIVVTGGGSFDWGDAGIGAAGAIGMTLVLIGGSLAVLRRRSRLAV
jgi:hypothetical protein